MPSRMERYYDSNVKSRTDKNKDLYRTIYENVEYSNVEGVSVIEKNEKIDIEKIKELINGTNNINKPRPNVSTTIKPLVEEIEEQKNYDIRDVLDKAKSERTDKDSRFANIKYKPILDELSNNKTLDSEENIKDMIETISMNSKGNYTSDLLDDLKSICDPNLKNEVKDEINNQETQLQNTKLIQDNLDKSFFTSSLDFSSEDFEDLKEIKENIKKNNILTKILLFILLVIIITGVSFLVYHFTK